jgi:hypothetical protein
VGGVVMRDFLIELHNLMKKHDVTLHFGTWYDTDYLEIKTKYGEIEFDSDVDYKDIANITQYKKKVSSADLHPDLFGGE